MAEYEQLRRKLASPSQTVRMEQTTDEILGTLAVYCRQINDSKEH